nr:metallophosphoesterase family protein [Halegenticoccus tardaugens]
MTVRFNDTVEPHHLRVDVDRWDDVYVVGDVHGCLAALRSLLSELDPGDDDLVAFVGDLIRKGPDNHGVAELVRESPNMVSVRGNNEEKVLRGEKTVPDLTDEDVAWIRSLPVAISWDGALVVHGGVDPRKPLSAHSIDDLQNTRSLAPDGSYDRPFWFERYTGPERVFFGHTVMARPAVHEHALGLDTGCVYGGQLTAYDWYGDEFVAVDAGRTVQDRKESKIVTPRTATVR